MYTPIYTLEGYTTFKAIQIFLKNNQNISVKKLYNNVTDTDKIQNSKSKAVVIIFFTCVLTRFNWFI